MEELASAIPAGEVGRVAYRLYERFRPAWKASAGRWGGAGRVTTRARLGVQ